MTEIEAELRQRIEALEIANRSLVGIILDLRRIVTGLEPSEVDSRH